MVDKIRFFAYNICMMININRVPNFILNEADNLAKETSLPFRDCLDIVISLRLKESTNESKELPIAVH